MPTSALLLALAAAVVHALWNVLLARARDPRAATAVALIVAEIVFAIPAWLLWRVDAAAWPFIVVSGVLQLVYFTLLITAYRLAPLSVVYPIARGGAPVLVLVFGVTVLGHGTSVGQVLGVCLVAAGILLVRGTRPTVGRGVALGLAVAAVIATYTLVDKVGVSHAGALPYLELSMLVPSLAYAGIYPRARLRAEINLSTVVAGVATFGAYCMVLLALQRASAASVAAVRETSVVLSALLARRYLAEPVGRARFAGAALVAGGIALVSLA
ncbi:MAG TPA: EamA family transporter [Gaiellaceae bacterium]|nr:EamA family transporter [Gaiellaceae bacterium]